MFRFALRILLSMVIFSVVVNKLPGAHYYGAGLLEPFILSLMMSFVYFLLIVLFIGFIISTMGLGLLAVPLTWLLAWLIPTIQLVILAHWYPQVLQFGDWISVLIVGLIFFVMHKATEAF